jgi:cobalt-zinc-cadmium efflux system outer membrane protein
MQLFVCTHLVSAHEDRHWTEAEVVTQVLQRPALRDALEGQVAMADGQRRAAGAYPNPQLSYLREQTFGSTGSGEDYLSVAQTLDLGHRRALASEAAAARVDVVRHENEAARIALAAEARSRFFELLYRQDRTAACEGFISRIDQALVIVQRRERSGDAAIYDRRRLERERAVAAAKAGVERAALERAQARLAAWLDSSGQVPSVTGALLPDSDPEPLAKLRSASLGRPDLRALAAAVAAASQGRKLASRWWLPDLRLEGGWKGVSMRGAARNDGFLVGASLALPLWDQSSALGQIAEGEARAASGRRSLLESELAGELAGARAEAVQLRAAALSFREHAANASADLTRIVSAGYEGGEQGLLELLDAYRGAADDALTALDMAHSARKARIELDRMTGSGLP